MSKSDAKKSFTQILTSMNAPQHPTQFMGLASALDYLPDVP